MADWPQLVTACDPTSAQYGANADAMRVLVDDLRDVMATTSLGGSTVVARAARVARQAAAPRPRRRAARSGLAVPRALAARRPRHVRRRGAGGGHHHRHRRGVGSPVRDRRQRRHGEGRHLLPDDGEEAPAGAGGRAPEPAAVHLPRRLRRRVPAGAGRRVPRPRSLRPDLLQPGADVVARHRPDRRRARLVHGGRCLRAGDERRGRDRRATRGRSSSAARRS